MRLIVAEAASTSTTRMRRARGGAMLRTRRSTARKDASNMNLKTSRMTNYEYLPDWAIID